MNLYPAIDIYQGRVVRLQRGDYEKETVYSNHPEEFAKRWQDQGAEWLHIVDLEGAKAGRVVNLESIRKIRQNVSCRMELGGGVRTLEDIRLLTDHGVDRVILGTRGLDPVFLTSALAGYGERIAVGLDCRSGRVQLEGWLKESALTLTEALGMLREYKISTIIYTDISKDGMLAGPNFEQLEMVLNESRAQIILSGGVSSLEDIQRASEIEKDNFEGVIIGKALYENKFELQEAVNIVSRKGIR